MTIDPFAFDPATRARARAHEKSVLRLASIASRAKNWPLAPFTSLARHGDAPVVQEGAMSPTEFAARLLDPGSFTGADCAVRGSGALRRSPARRWRCVGSFMIPRAR